VYKSIPSSQDRRSDNLATIDHKIPKSRGGRGGNNLVYACQKCNTLKGERTPEEWKQGLAPQDANTPTREGPYELIPFRGWRWVGYEE